MGGFVFLDRCWNPNMDDARKEEGLVHDGGSMMMIRRHRDEGALVSLELQHLDALKWNARSREPPLGKVAGQVQV